MIGYILLFNKTNYNKTDMQIKWHGMINVLKMQAKHFLIINSSNRTQWEHLQEALCTLIAL